MINHKNKIFYHGSPYLFDKFDINRGTGVIYITPDIDAARAYGLFVSGNRGCYIYSVKIKDDANIINFSDYKNPAVELFHNKEYSEDEWLEITTNTSTIGIQSFDFLDYSRESSNLAIKHGVDGFYIKDTIHEAGYSEYIDAIAIMNDEAIYIVNVEEVDGDGNKVNNANKKQICKKSWPWIGTNQHEMGNDSLELDELDKQEESHKMHDSLVSEKFTTDEQVPTMGYYGGIMSPVNEVSYADDDQVSIDIEDDDGIIANFSCDIASSFSKKIIGLQSYSSLTETAGLLFPYKLKSDVIYHMGKVSFPIDIIFIDDNHKIKKMYKNIQPGTLGTFGCANTKNVLEICGGLSDRLGISVGNKVMVHKKDNSALHNLNKVAKSLGIEKDIILQYSDVFRPGFHKWNGQSIYVVNNSLNKSASDGKHVSELIAKFSKSSIDDVLVFDFDGLINKSPNITLYNCNDNFNDNSKSPFIKLNGDTTFLNEQPGVDVSKDVDIREVTNLDGGYEIICASDKSIGLFLSKKDIHDELKKMLSSFNQAFFNKRSKIAIATRFSNPELIKNVICSKAKYYYGYDFDANVIKLDKNSDINNIVNTVRAKYGALSNIKIFSDESLLKMAGTPIPNEVKEKAKKARGLLEDALDISSKSLENINKNLSEYTKIKDSPNAISGTKDLYQESIRNNTHVVRKYLIKIRDSIKILNSIKDISTTMEIVESIIAASRVSSDIIEEIFDLINSIELPDFFSSLDSLTNEYEKSIEDLQSTLDRAINYINKDILGIIILYN